MNRPLERVSLGVYDMAADGLTAPDARGGFVYSPLWIPPHLRTETYDRLVCENPVAPSPKDPDEFMAEHRARWAKIENVRTRIVRGELAVRTLLGQGALRQTLGQTPALLGLQIDSLEQS